MNWIGTIYIYTTVAVVHFKAKQKHCGR